MQLSPGSRVADSSTGVLGTVTARFGPTVIVLWDTERTPRPVPVRYLRAPGRDLQGVRWSICPECEASFPVAPGEPLPPHRFRGNLCPGGGKSAPLGTGLAGPEEDEEQRAAIARHKAQEEKWHREDKIRSEAQWVESERRRQAERGIKRPAGNFHFTEVLNSSGAVAGWRAQFNGKLVGVILINSVGDLVALASGDAESGDPSNKDLFAAFIHLYPGVRESLRAHATGLPRGDDDWSEYEKNRLSGLRGLSGRGRGPIDYGNALTVVYGGPPSQAWYVMWHDQVLKIANTRSEAEHYATQISTPGVELLQPRRVAKAKAKVTEVFKQAYDAMAADPGFQEEARKRRLEEKKARFAAGPLKFRVGQRVRYNGYNGDGVDTDARPWVGIVRSAQYRENDINGPGNYYEVDWQTQHGVSQDWLTQDQLVPA